jgi:hypothetical protein
MRKLFRKKNRYILKKSVTQEVFKCVFAGISFIIVLVSAMVIAISMSTLFVK